MKSGTDRSLGRLHLIADFDVARDDVELRRRVVELLERGLPSLQVRAVGRGTAELVERGEPLRAEAARAGATFVVNRDVAAAIALDADGVHLSSRGPSLDEVRREFGGAVGTSCHTSRELDRARDADWVFLSPVFPTPSKPGALTLGLEGLRELCRRVSCPLYALGGVDATNFSECLEAGATGVAAIRALLGPRGEEFVESVLAWEAQRKPESR